MPQRMHDHEVDVSAELVRSLIDDQFPEYRRLLVTLVEPWGTDNAIWRLGDDLVVRLPRVESATDQIGLEARWLPWMAPRLTVAVPRPIAIGAPARGYPFPWAVHQWLPGRGAALDLIADPGQFALDLAKTVLELAALPTNGAPSAKNRARAVQVYDQSTRRFIQACHALIDTDAALEVWQDALEADVPAGEPRWVHGDLEGNCVVNRGVLTGLLDWGSACVGDRAVDVQVAWSPLFTEDSRDLFLRTLDVDDATVARAKGAAINQACGALSYYLHTYPLIVERSRHKLRALGVAVHV